MDLILEDYDASVLTPVHDEGVGAVQDDAVTVPEIKGHQRIATLGPLRPSREVIAEFEDRILSDRVEVVFAVDEAGKP
jgi:hypothetical protein